MKKIEVRWVDICNETTTIKQLESNTGEVLGWIEHEKNGEYKVCYRSKKMENIRYVIEAKNRDL